VVPAGKLGVRWVAGHPVAALIVWFFTVGQAIAFIPVIASSAGADLPLQPFTIASTWVGLLLPAVAITRLVHGRDAARALLSRLSLVRQPLRWYALCLVVVPLTSLAIVTAMVGAPTEASVSDLVRAGLVAFGVHAWLHLVMNNLWEELAWTGFVQAQLQDRHAPVLAALATAPLFALQHSPLVFGGNSVAGGAVVMLALVGLAVPFRMVMGWILNRTGSLFLVGVAHACGNAVVTGTVVGDALVPDLFGRNVGPVHLFAFAAIGVVVAVATRARWGSRCERTYRWRRQRPRCRTMPDSKR
jgi:membrane protease YdiL (CAAX protease family)